MTMRDVWPHAPGYTCKSTDLLDPEYQEYVVEVEGDGKFPLSLSEWRAERALSREGVVA